MRRETFDLAMGIDLCDTGIRLLLHDRPTSRSLIQKKGESSRAALAVIDGFVLKYFIIQLKSLCNLKHHCFLLRNYQVMNMISRTVSKMDSINLKKKRKENIFNVFVSIIPKSDKNYLDDCDTARHLNQQPKRG